MLRLTLFILLTAVSCSDDPDIPEIDRCTIGEESIGANVNLDGSCVMFERGTWSQKSDHIQFFLSNDRLPFSEILIINLPQGWIDSEANIVVEDFQMSIRDFDAILDEAFIPDTTQISSVTINNIDEVTNYITGEVQLYLIKNRINTITESYPENITIPQGEFRVEKRI